MNRSSLATRCYVGTFSFHLFAKGFVHSSWRVDNGSHDPAYLPQLIGPGRTPAPRAAPWPLEYKVWWGRHSGLYEEAQRAWPVGYRELNWNLGGLGVHSPDGHGQNKLADRTSQSKESSEPSWETLTRENFSDGFLAPRNQKCPIFVPWISLNPEYIPIATALE